MAFTVDQEKAIRAETGSLLVSAAAGSGKTSVLTQRIIRKLTGENPVTPDSLLVVTFTRAAAAEMRDRVFRGITELMQGADYARRAELAKIQSRLSDMNISTMDSFCMNVVKEYFHELSLDAEIGVMDEGEAAELRGKTAAQVLEKVLTERPEDFEALSSAFSKTGNDSGITDAVLRLSAYAQSEADPERWLASLPDAYAPGADESVWTDVIRRFTGENLTYCASLLDDCENLLDEVPSDDHRKKLETYLSDIRPFLENARSGINTAAWDELCETAGQLAEKMKAVRFPILRNAGEAKESIKAKRDTVIAVAEKAGAAFCATLEEHRGDMAAQYPAVKALADTVILFDRVLLEKKKKKHVYEFGDITHFALKLLYDADSPDGKTETAREYGARFSEILIDEYQDTNGAQDALFLSLSKGDGENMFTVGDVKQSIYRFRLAEPGIFTGKCESFPPYDGEKTKSKILLRENFRCRRGIIDGVNFLFGRMMSKGLGGVTYDEDSRLNYGAAYYDASGIERTQPDVRFRLLECDGTTLSEARFVARDIAARVGTDEVLARDGTVRRAVPGDFAVLMRSPSYDAEIWKNVFAEYGLSLVAGKGGNLYDYAEIRLLNAMLAAIDNPRDDVAATAVMMSPFFGFTPDDMADVKNACAAVRGKHGFIYGGALALAEKGHAKCAAFVEKMRLFRRLAEGEGPAQLLRDIDSEFAFSSSCLAPEDGDIRYNNIILYIETAQAAESRGVKTAGAFARYIDSLRDNGVTLKGAAAGGGENSIRLMSIHQSKGLEFPFVYIAKLGSSSAHIGFNKEDLNKAMLIENGFGIGLKRRESDTLKYYDTLPYTAIRLSAERELLSEEMRIYYVALTRARETLTIVCCTPDAEKKCRGTENQLPGAGALPVGYLAGAFCAADWFIAAFARHPDGGELRVRSRGETGSFGRADIGVVCDLNGEDRQEEEARTAEPDAEMTARIAARANWLYPRTPIASRLSRFTASGAEEKHFSAQKFTRKKPAFLDGGRLTGAEKGTATHLFMEYCDFDRCEKDIEGEIERLFALGRLTRAQADSLDREAILTFLRSPVMEEVRNADETYREKRFVVCSTLGEEDASVPESFADEPVMMIGQLDLLIVKNGQATVIDYKTDRIRTDVTELREKYARQMDIYVRAVRLSMDVPVKKVVLYSLDKKEFA